jgi:hypothetical protein
VAFGTTAGTVAAGNHVHAGYQPLLSGAIPCPAGSFVSNISPTTGVVTCQAESTGQLYTAGYGLNLATGEFSVNTNLIQVKLAGACTAGQFVSSIDPVTGAFTCATPLGKVYTSGEGITISGSDQILVNFNVAQRRVSIGGDIMNGTCPAGQVLKGINPGTGALTCVVDQTTGSSGGEIVSVTGVAPIVSTDDGAGHVQIEVAMGTTAGTVAAGNHGHAEFADFADYDETISAITCAVGQVVKYDGTGWVCANDIDTDTNTTYTAGTGLTLTGTVFTPDTAFLQRRVGSGCAAGQAIRAIDATGAVTCEAFPTYTAGTGLSLSGTQFAVNTTAIQARVTGTCPAGQSIRTIAADGGVTCHTDVDTNTTYTAGTGLTLTSTTFAADAAYLQRRVLATCAAGSSIRAIAADGTVTCEADDDTGTTYTAGTGLTLTGTAFSADAGYLQRRVSATCAAGQSIRAIAVDGSVTCEADDDTAYTAGTGLTLTGTQFAANTTVVQSRVTGTCAAGQSIRSIAADGTVTCEVDDDTNTTYTAGSGLALTGTAFSAVYAGAGSANSAARSDHNHTGTYLPFTTCTTGYVLKYNGTAWACAPDDDTNTTYTAGTGLQLTGTAFAVNPAAVQTRVSGTCAAGNYVRAIAENGTVTCQADTDTNTTYSAGTGLTLTGTTFSANTSVLQNRVSGTCAAGSSIQTIAADGTVTCHTDVDTNTTYTAGSGLTLAGTAFSVTWAGTGTANTASRSDHTHSAYTYTAGTGLTLTGSAFAADMTYLQRRVSGTCGPGYLVQAIDPNTGIISCAEDQTTGSGDGTVVSVTGVSPVVATTSTTGHVQVSVLTGTTTGTLATGDHTHAEFAEFADYDEPLEGIDMCTNGQVLKYNAGTAAWECGSDVDTNTTYSAGTALTLSGTTFNVNLGTTSATAAAGNHTHAAYTYAAGTGLTLAGTTFSADAAYLQRRVTGTCAAGSSIQAVAADGTVTCHSDANTTYTAGTGLSLSGTQFAVNTAAIQARVGTTCAAGSSIREITAAGGVTCQTDANTTYTAGTGLSLSGTAFSAVYAGTGSANSAARSDHDHTGTYLPFTTCTNGYVLKYISGSWTCAADNDTTYTAGTGLTLTGTAFSANTTTIQARVGSTCAAGSSIRVINADGTVTCEEDDDTNTTYTAGTGLTLAGTTFATDSNVVQNRVTGTCAAGSSISTITAAGGVTCQTDNNTTYTAGTGLSLSGTQFAVNTSTIQARVGTTCAAGSSIREITAAGGVTCQADSNTTYAAGNGLTLTGTTFAASYAGTGTANTLARSDHNHDATYSGVSHNHDATYVNKTGDTMSGALNITTSGTVDSLVINNNHPDGNWWGVYSTAASTQGRGVTGIASATTGTTYGMWAQSNSNTGRALYGLAQASTGTNYGIFAATNSADGYAGYFSGRVYVTGALTVNGALTANSTLTVNSTTTSTGNFIAGNNYTYSSTKTGYYNIGPGDFIPENNNPAGLNSWIGSSEVRLQGTSPNYGLIAPVHLPNSVTVTQFACWVYDNNATAGAEVAVALRFRTFGSSGVGVGTVADPPNSGNSTSWQNLSATSTHSVNNGFYDYYVQTFLGSGTSTTWDNLKVGKCIVTYTYSTLVN